MKVLVATDAHIYRLPDGTCWCKSIYGYSFWKRYLYTFDDVQIVARTKKCETIDENMLRVDGDHVEIYGIPFFQGPKELLKHYVAIKKSLHRMPKDYDAAIFRMPSPTAKLVYNTISKRIPIGGEIVFDPKTAEYKTLLAKTIAKVTSIYLKRFCLKANGVSYVTEHAIQDHYPCQSLIHGESKEFFSGYYSSISLSDEAFGEPRKFEQNTCFRLVMSDAAMNSYRKGEKTVIETVSELRKKGYPVYAVFMGDGSLRKEFENYSKELNVSEYITFTGMIPSSNEVRKVLKASDIMMFPSKGEGLPRGILEAMAVGLPVLSTAVGGIPEVIDSKYLFDPDDAKAFAEKLIQLINNRSELNQMSQDNYTRALDFRNSILQSRRNDFYKKLLELVKNKQR